MYHAQDDVKSHFKLAQFWHFVKTADQQTKEYGSHKGVIDNILKDDFNVNQRFTIKSEYPHKKYLKDCTALHSVYRGVCDIVAFNSLLEHGADFTVKNGKGKTVLHLASNSRSMESVTNRANPVFNSIILSAHVKYQNAANPQDDNGFSHMHGACITNHVESLKLFLDNGVSVNQVVYSKSENYPGFTPLHFAVLFDSFEAAQILVSRGADISAKNARGLTPLDMCLEHRVKIFHLIQEANYKNIETYQNQHCNSNNIIKLLLNSQCVDLFSWNGFSAVGLSKLHVASTLTDLSIAENLLYQVSDIDCTVPRESPIFPGYTAAHFAASNNLNAMKMLITHGAKLDIKNADGLTPIDICINNYSIQDLHNSLEYIKYWRNIYLSDDKTRLLDFLDATANLDKFKSFMQKVVCRECDITVPNQCLQWQGYTMLHLAVTISNDTQDNDLLPSIVEECLKVKQSVNIQNPQGESAIHLAFKQGKINILQLLLNQLNNQEKVANLVDQDNLSYLHIACAQNNAVLVDKLLRTSEPNITYKGKKITFDRLAIVAGSTPLHVAACSYQAIAIAEALLRHGADLHATDCNGMTPIHCLMKSYISGIGNRGNQQVADVLFRALLNNPEDCVVDKIGLTYLHVACLFNNEQVVPKLLELGSNVNAVISSNKQFLSKYQLYSLQEYSTFMPLHMTQVTRVNPSTKVIDLLILNGADVFAKTDEENTKRSNSKFLLGEKDVIMPRFMSMLWNHEKMQKQMEDKLGLTRLHIACYMKNKEFIRSALSSRVVNVNAQIHTNSDIFPGCTPLHLLLTTSRNVSYSWDLLDYIATHNQHNPEPFAVAPIIDLLLARGADVTIMDAKKNTPIHLLCKYQDKFTDAYRSEDLLMNAHRNFIVNPANEEGISHFHLACYFRNLEVIEKFLQHGSVEVNQPIDFFADAFPGCTPLHLTFMIPHNRDSSKITQIVDLLLKYGANVAAKDVRGDTSLHKTASLMSPQLGILEKLVNHGADVNVENVKGQTPLDIILLNGNDYFSIFKKYNYRINSWNRITGQGRIGKILSSHSNSFIESPEFKELLQSSDVKVVDEMGRTVIHNSVAVERLSFGNGRNVISAIEKFITLGIDLDHQDKSGQTALHYAARMGNIPGVVALLKCGADVNTADNSRMSALSYALEHSERMISYIPLHSVIMSLNLHVQKLLQLKIEVSELNRTCSNTVDEILDRCTVFEVVERIFSFKRSLSRQIEMTKSVDTGAASLVLFDFLNETGGITLYPFLSKSGRTVIDDFFRNHTGNEIEELSDILILQYRKMKARFELIDPALTALREHLGFSFPGLCEQITRYLKNTDLKNLIASTPV